jgi:hypothetical protein
MYLKLSWLILIMMATKTDFNNSFYMKLSKAIYMLNSAYRNLASNYDFQNQTIESVLINCVDSYDNYEINQPSALYQYITPQLSLNRLFELAKEEHYSHAHI